MPECSYCDEAFDDETAYLEHLRDEHGDELGAIDRRRVETLEGDGSSISRTGLLLGGLVVVVVAVLAVVFALGNGGGSGVSPDGIEAETLPERGEDALLGDVQRFPSQGAEHVAEGTEIDYETTPPTSGPHYGSTVDAGFYTETPALGSLVHTLEHGAVVVYYDPDALTPEARQSLREFAAAHTGTWSSVVVAPHPEANPESPYVLTAWRTMLRMDAYDPQVVQAFLAEYLGRGPENPVR